MIHQFGLWTRELDLPGLYHALLILSQQVIASVIDSLA